jgi:uncharacterized cupredoxin-like copper-binding protein
MHTSFKHAPSISAVIALTLAAAACGGATSTTTTAGMDDMGSEFAFGQPADPTEADRTIEITASDELTFDPAEITVSPGEVITFRVVNEGQIAHDFTLGDEATQDEHEEEMAEMGGMDHDEPNAMVLAAGETKELTWRFAEEGPVIFGCHQPGHYAAGMRGEITAES